MVCDGLSGTAKGDFFIVAADGFCWRKKQISDISKYIAQQLNTQRQNTTTTTATTINDNNNNVIN